MRWGASTMAITHGARPPKVRSFRALTQEQPHPATTNATSNHDRNGVCQSPSPRWMREWGHKRQVDRMHRQVEQAMGEYGEAHEARDGAPAPQNE